MRVFSTLLTFHALVVMGVHSSSFSWCGPGWRLIQSKCYTASMEGMSWYHAKEVKDAFRKKAKCATQTSWST